MINAVTPLLLFQASNASMPWWQVISGLLAIPATLLGLVYTYRLYQKTHLEMRRLALEIAEKELELGLKEVSSRKVPTPNTSQSDTSEPVQRSSQNLLRHRIHFISPIVGGTIVSLGLAWIAPQPVPLGSHLGYATEIISASLVVIISLVTAVSLRFKSAWIVAAVAIAAFILSMLAAFSYFYLRAQYVVRLDLPGERIEFLAGTDLSATAKEYLARNPLQTKEELLKNFGYYNASKIWTTESIKTIQRSLITLFVAFITLCSILTVTVTQLVLHGWNKELDETKSGVELGQTTQLSNDGSDAMEGRSQLEVIGMIASSIEHDLKTPLSSMGMHITSMRRRFLHYGEVVNRLDDLQHELVRISSIVEIIPALRADKAFYERSEFMRKTNLLEVVHRAVRSVKNEKPTLKGNEPRTIIKIDGKDAWVRAYGPMLEQVVVNVIKNALEAIDEAEKSHGVVRINVTSSEAFRGPFRRLVELRVEDNGCGIPKDNLHKLTGLFTTRAGKKPNSGVGLFVARRILNIHEGEILFESVENEGATVIIRLPEWNAYLKGLSAEGTENSESR